jgi:Cdc6-like AAA superfamily ATPase
MDFYRNRAPELVFKQRALDFLNNPVALGHWLKHYFVTGPFIAHQDESGSIILVCTVNFRVPIRQINGESYLNFFRPLLEEHVTEVNVEDLNINRYPSILTKTLDITAMRATLDGNVLDRFRDLPKDIARCIQKSGCKDVLTFLQWLQQNMVNGRRDSEAFEHPPYRTSRKHIAAKRTGLSIKMSHNTFRYLEVLDDVEKFYNRGSEVREALELLRKPEDGQEQGNVEVTGPRKIGKTWFLRYISRPTVLQEYGIEPQRNIFVYIDCQRRWKAKTEDQVYQGILECIVETAHRAGIDLVPEPCDGFGVSTAFEQTLQEMHRQGLRVVLLLDEFEQIARNPNLDDSFFDHLRSLYGATDVNVAYVTASHTSLLDLEHESLLSSPFFNVFEQIPLGLFSEQDSRHLIEDSLHRIGTRFPKDLMELVLEVGGGHPFFLKMAGHHACKLETAGEELRKEEREVFLESFEAKATRHFRYYWGKLNDEQHYVLATLPTLRRDPGYRETIKYLRDQCLIIKRKGRYEYFSPLFETFVRRQNVNGVLQAGPLLVDQQRVQVLLCGEPLNLRPISYAILTYLMQREGQVVGREELQQTAWDEEPYDVDEQFKSALRSLRNALGNYRYCIENRRGVGYMFQVPADD